MAPFARRPRWTGTTRSACVGLKVPANVIRRQASPAGRYGKGAAGGIRMEDDIAQRIRTFVEREILSADTWGSLRLTTPLLGLLDSLALRDLLSFVEEEFGVEIEPEEVNTQNFETIGSVASLVETRLGRPPS